MALAYACRTSIWWVLKRMLLVSEHAEAPYLPYEKGGASKMGFEQAQPCMKPVTSTSDLGLRSPNEDSYQCQSTSMSGLGEAAGITGLIVFSLQSLKICVAGMDLILRARDFATYADRHRAQLDWQKHLLQEWHERVLLAENDVFSPQRNLNWTRIKDILGQLKILLTDVERLKDIYHLQIDPSENAIVGEMMPPETGANSFLDKIRRRFKPNVRTLTAKHINEQSNLWSKGRFAVHDDTNIKRLVEDVTVFVEDIWDCLRDDDRDFLVRGMQFLLRQAISQTPTVEGIKNLEPFFNPVVASHSSQAITEAVHMASILKETRLKLAVDLSQREEAVNSGVPGLKTPRSVRLKSGDIVIDKLLSETRSLGTYNMQPVLVEWKAFEKRWADKLKPRIEALGILLSKANDHSICSLPFLGFFQEYDQNRYALIFEIRPSIDAELVARPIAIQTLHDRLSQTAPPIKERVDIALSLARAVRQLHTAGWLHKGIRSENLLFFDAGKEDHKSLQGPYLAYFVYARAVCLTEFSEPALNASDVVSRALYTHKGNLEGSSFRKSFDVFSLGLVLLEIGLWKDIQGILSESEELYTKAISMAPLDSGSALVTLRDGKLSAVGNNSIRTRLQNACPDFYNWAVTRCLDVATISDLDELESSIELQTTIVEDLERSQAATEERSSQA